MISSTTKFVAEEGRFDEAEEEEEEEEEDEDDDEEASTRMAAEFGGKMVKVGGSNAKIKKTNSSAGLYFGLFLYQNCPQFYFFARSFYRIFPAIA
jgi:hypothetical protein